MMIFGGTDDSAVIRDSGMEVYPAGAGEVFGASFGQAWESNPTVLAVRYAWRRQIEADTPSLGGIETGFTQPENFGAAVIPDLMTPEDANKEFKIPGMLPFDRPVSRQIAESIYKGHQERRARESIIERSEGGVLGGGAAQFTAGLMASALDPLNVASAFIPVAPAARVAAAMARAGGMGGRAAVRAGVGVAEGAVGAAIVEPFVYGMSRDEHNDYTMGNSALNIALGAVLGGALHTGVGAVVDWRASAADRALARANAVLAPESRESGLNSSISAILEGRTARGAEVAQASELLRVAGEVTARADSIAQAINTSRMAEIRTIADEIRTAARPQYAPVSLLDFIGQRGGVQDQGGNLSALGVNTHFVPGQGRIVRENGLTLDYARRAAEEAGYLRPDSTVADLLDAIAEEMAGRRVYLPHEHALVHERRLAAMSDRELERLDAYQDELRDIAEAHGVRLSDAELEHATVLTMYGAYPDEALRVATLGNDLSVTGFMDDAMAESARIIKMADSDLQGIRERIAQAETEIAALRQSAMESTGDVESQISTLDSLQVELDNILKAERDAGRLAPEQERMLAEVSEAAKEADAHAKAYEAAGMCAAVSG